MVMGKEKLMEHLQPTRDAQGVYPSEESLEAIKKWDLIDDTHKKVHALLDFVEALWEYPERFSWYKSLYRQRYKFIKSDGTPDKTKYRKLYLSTGGWSGNEDIIESLRLNFIFWSMCWAKSVRGGHYWFIVPEIGKT
jgi:hypothetical protein